MPLMVVLTIFFMVGCDGMFLVRVRRAVWRLVHIFIGKPARSVSIKGQKFSLVFETAGPNDALPVSIFFGITVNGSWHCSVGSEGQ